MHILAWILSLFGWTETHPAVLPPPTYLVRSIAVSDEKAVFLAPTSGRVITVPVTAGTVVMAGDTVATVAEQNFVLRPSRSRSAMHAL